MSTVQQLEPKLAGINNQGDGLNRKHKRKREEAVTVEAEDQLGAANEPKKERKRKHKGKDDADTGTKAKKHKKVHTEYSNTTELVASEKGDGAQVEKKLRRKKHSESEGQGSEMRTEKKTKEKRPKTKPVEGPQYVEKTDQHTGHVQENGQNSEEEALSEIVKPKKKRKASTKSVDDGEPTKKSKRKNQVTATEVVTETSANEGEEAPRKKGKRRQREEAGEKHADTSEKAEPSASPKKKKKRSSHKHSEFPDPSEDTILSDPARKALEYVHARVSSYLNWKFNKARQNWVLRNIWDDTAIPEKYIPSCVKYLAGVQGNTRELLIKSSTQLIESPSDPKVEATTEQTEDQKAEANSMEGVSLEEQQRKRDLKIARARTLLAALQAGVESTS